MEELGIGSRMTYPYSMLTGNSTYEAPITRTNY